MATNVITKCYYYSCIMFKVGTEEKNHSKGSCPSIAGKLPIIETPAIYTLRWFATQWKRRGTPGDK